MKTTRNCLFNPVIFALLALSSLMGLAQNNTQKGLNYSHVVDSIEVNVDYSKSVVLIFNIQLKSV